MIPYAAYKVIHLLGMFLLFTILGGISLHVLNGGTRESNVGRKLAGALHGVALFVILLGGFGMLARLGMVQGSFPGWIWAKLTIWVLLGAFGTLPYRKPGLAKAFLFIVPLMGALAAWFALYKPI